ncbi:MAG: hypothetical protein KDA46_05745 [Parvularculaceae bacterium]|nr:hypothetical protein [Parvularculaceae bacterium]
MRPRFCDQSGALNPRLSGERSRFAFVAVFYLVAQLLVAAHAPTFAGDYIDHIPNECAACLAGAAVDDPSANGPALVRVGYSLDLASAPAPVVQHAVAVVTAASPRAPPSI